MTAIPPEAITHAGNVLRKKWMTDRPGIYHVDLDPMLWAETVAAALEPFLSAEARGAACDRITEANAARRDERRRIRQLAVSQREQYSEHARQTAAGLPRTSEALMLRADTLGEFISMLQDDA